MKSRFKTRGGVVNEMVDWLRKTPTGPWTLNATYQFATSINKMTTQGWDVPDYHKKKRQGELIPMTPFEQIEQIGTNGGYYAWTDSGGYQGKYAEQGKTSFLSTWIATPGDCEENINVDYADLLQAAAARIYSSGWDALTFAAELRKTVGMFRSSYRTFYNLARDARFRRNFVNDFFFNKRKPEDAKKWLEYRYGWRTLVYDIKDLTKALNNIDSRRERYSERVGYTLTGSSNVTSEVNLTSARSGESITTEKSWQVSVRGSVVADIKAPTFALNPVTTAWELTPYSFVVDWFVDVGQFLESMSFLALATNYTAASGLHMSLRKKQYVNEGSLATGFTACTLESESDCTVDWTVRSPMSLSKIPQVKVNLDVSKLIDLVALAKVRR